MRLLSAVIPIEGPEWRDRFEQPFRKAPDAIPQRHQRNRCATLKNGFIDPRRFALLRTASLGMTGGQINGQIKVSGMNGGSLGALATFEPGFLGQKCGFGASAAAKGTAIRVRNL